MVKVLKLEMGGEPFNYIRFALRARVPLAFMVMAFAGLGALTNFLSVTWLMQPLNGGAATHPVTALCLLGLGVSILRTRRFGRNEIWRTGVLSVILLTCVTRVMDALVVAVAGGAPTLMFGPLGNFTGQFSMEAAITIGAFSGAALARQGSGQLGGLLLAIGLGFVFSTMVELTYGLEYFAGDVGVFTFLGLASASLAMMSVYVHRPFVRVAFLRGDLGSQTRVMGVAVAIVPWAAGFVLHKMGQTGTSGLPYEATMISVMSCFMMVILLTTSARHEGSVARRRRAERDEAMSSRVDPVTGALNRFGITEVVEGAWVDFRSSGANYGLILMDLDYFRDLDQAFGAGDGEAVLARVAETLMPHLRASDALGRWGADEFLVTLRVKRKSDLVIVAKRLRAALSDPTAPFLAGLDLEPAAMHIPLGIGTMDLGDESPTDAIVRADQRLHLEQQTGAGLVPLGNGRFEPVFAFAPEAEPELEELLDLEVIVSAADSKAA